jgi:hypothetical protein
MGNMVGLGMPFFGGLCGPQDCWRKKRLGYPGVVAAYRSIRVTEVLNVQMSNSLYLSHPTLIVVSTLLYLTLVFPGTTRTT